MGENSIFLIDIDKVLRDKAGKKADRIPRFLVSYLKHIVHQDEINVFLKSVADKTGVDFLEACMEFLDIKLEVKGIENLPSDGLCTFVSNHPFRRTGWYRLRLYIGQALQWSHKIPCK